jgi:transcriptional regulator with XRE-family HTH domain
MTGAADARAATDRPAPLTPARLRARRQALGLSQEGLGRALGVSAKTVGGWERGEQPLANPVLLQLAIERLEDVIEHAGRPGTAPQISRTRAWHGRSSDNLPTATSPLVGRRTELRTVQQLVATHRLVTLCGTAGIGKTRLALEVARRLNRRTVTGVWLVELAGLVDSGSLAHTVAAQLEIRQAPGRSLVETLVDTLADQAVLLLLDNCEHVVHACAELVEALLHGCASCGSWQQAASHWAWPVS